MIPPWRPRGEPGQHRIEVTTYLNLSPGVYRFGVNSDDGFHVTAGKRSSRSHRRSPRPGRRRPRRRQYPLLRQCRGRRLLPDPPPLLRRWRWRLTRVLLRRSSTGEFRLINDTNSPNSIKALHARTQTDLRLGFPPPNSVNVRPTPRSSPSYRWRDRNREPGLDRPQLNGTPGHPHHLQAGPSPRCRYQPAPGTYLPSGNQYRHSRVRR